MATQHDYYEELCALAISGQIAPDQLKSLKQHLETCADCLSTLADFGEIAGHVIESARRRISVDPPSGMTDRFIARAHSEGIPLSAKAASRQIASNKKWVRNSALLAAGLILLLLLKIRLTEHANIPAKVSLEPPAGRVNDGSPHGPNSFEQEAVSQQVAALEKQVAGLTADIRAKQRALELARAEESQLTGRLDGLEKDDSGLRQALTESDRQIARLTAEAAQTKQQLDRLLFAKSADEFRSQTVESEANDLRAKVASLREEVAQSQQLSVAAEEAKELIVARHLHIVDVDDTDGNGRRERPFGRIFYAEGKSLVFYAYDLTDPRRLNARINFYAWGSQEGIAKPVRSLGIFHPDDEKDGRWVLRFEDPTVLAQINCVFVTAEPNKKQVTQPSGRQILFASLGPKPNHP